MKFLIVTLLLASCASYRLTNKNITQGTTYKTIQENWGEPQECHNYNEKKYCFWQDHGIVVLSNNQFQEIIEKPIPSEVFVVQTKVKPLRKLSGKKVFIESVDKNLSKNLPYVKALFTLKGFEVVTDKKESEVILKAGFSISKKYVQKGLKKRHLANESLLTLSLHDSKSRRTLMKAVAVSVGHLAEVDTLFPVLSYSLRPYLDEAIASSANGEIVDNSIDFVSYKHFSQHR